MLSAEAGPAIEVATAKASKTRFQRILALLRLPLSQLIPKREWLAEQECVREMKGFFGFFRIPRGGIPAGRPARGL
jgi:hypothetical protein